MSAPWTPAICFRQGVVHEAGPDWFGNFYVALPPGDYNVVWTRDAPCLRFDPASAHLHIGAGEVAHLPSGGELLSLAPRGCNQGL